MGIFLRNVQVNGVMLGFLGGDLVDLMFLRSLKVGF